MQAVDTNIGVRTNQGRIMRTRPLSKKKVLFGLLLISTWVPIIAQGVPPDEATTELEEVLVTATRRAMNVQEVPVSVAIIPGQRLDDMRINRLEQATDSVPGVTVAQTVIADHLFIRGLGSGNGPGFEQSVATFIDGVHFGRGRTSRNPFMDIESLEVLKGAQGVLFGKNTVAGVLNFRTRRPKDYFEATTDASWNPEFDNYRFNAAVSGLIAAGLKGRVAGQYNTANGYVDNSKTGGNDPESDEWQLRGTLVYQPNEELEVMFKLEGGAYDISGQSHQIVQATPVLAGLSQAADPTAEFELDFDKSNGSSDPIFGEEFYNVGLMTSLLDLRWRLPHVELIATIAYHSYTLDSLGDGEAAPIDLVAVGFDDEQYDAFTQELRLESELGGKIEYVAGAYYGESDLDTTLRAHFGFDSVPAIGTQLATNGLLTAFSLSNMNTEETETWSLYGEGRYQLSDRIALIAGLRYTDEQKTGSHNLLFSILGGAQPDPLANITAAVLMIGPANNVPFLEVDTDNTSASLIAEYELSDEARAYARFAQGFKAGGFNGLGDTYGDETADSFELGLKTRLLDRRLTLNAAYFNTKLDDMQVSIFDGSATFIVDNVAQATTRGFELESRYLVAPNVTLGLSVAYIDAEYDSFPGAACPIGQGVVCDLSGRPLSYAPEWSGNLYVETAARVWSGWSMRGILELQATSEFYTAADADPRSIQHGYGKINAGVYFTSPTGRYGFSVIGRNLTDRVTSTFIDDVALGAVLGANFFAFVDPPRTINLQFNLTY